MSSTSPILHVKKLLDSAGPNGGPKWSPDGKEIAYTTSNGQPFFYYANSYIAAIPAERRPAAPAHARSSTRDPNLLDWGPDGIYFTATQKTAAHLFRVDPATRAVRRISGPDAFSPLARPSPSDSPHASLRTGAAPNRFPEIFVSSVVDFAPRYLTDVAAQYKDFRSPPREVVQWKSEDGAAIEGILIKPADYDPTRKYPLLVVIHGGPTGVDSPADGRRPLLPDRALRRQGCARPQAELPRLAQATARSSARSTCATSASATTTDVITGVDSLIAQGHRRYATASAQWAGARAATSPRSSPATATASRRSVWARASPTG